MLTPQQKKSRARKQLIEQRVFIAFIAILFLGGAVILWILNGQGVIQGSWSNIFSIVFIFVSVLIGLFQWLFPVNGSPSEAVRPVASPVADPPSTPIIVQIPPTVPPSEQAAPGEEKAVYRGIRGLPPPTDPRTIQQRERAVEDVYTRLVQSTTSAVVLTGLGGVGKSTLAALVYKYAETQRLAGQGIFTHPAIWLNIDPAVTMADLAGNLCEIFGKPLPDFSNLSLPHQALALFNILNTPDECRLLVLDQFENLLDWQTGHALADRPGVGEWLDALNSQVCHSRLLLTTRPWPLGTRVHLPIYLQEYTVRRLDPDEGVDLLRKLGIVGTDEALHAIVERCGGHVFALMLLASLLRTRKLKLSTFLNDPGYAPIWAGDVARNLLDNIYATQLNAIQQKLLLAFSVYREPVPLEAARTLCDFVSPVSNAQIQQALDGLLAQHLLQPVGDGNYQLHAIVEDYAHASFVSDDEQANDQALRTARARAARYYLRFAENHSASQTQNEHPHDYDALVEATWQLCQAEQWREAYNLIEGKRLFGKLKVQGDLVGLLELYKLLLPLEKWQASPQESALIHNHLGSIYRSLGRREQAFRHLDQAITFCQEIGDTLEEAWSLNHMGRLYAAMGEKERASAFYEEVLKRARAEQQPLLEAVALNNLGVIYSAWGKRDLERLCYEEALNLYRAMGNRRGEAATRNNLGRVAEDSENYEQAEQYYRQALDLFQAADDRRGRAWTLNNLGRASYFLLDDKAHAREYLTEALQIRREIDRKGTGRTLNNLGAVATGDGDYAQAWKNFLEALEIATEIADLEGRGKIFHNLGLLCLVQKQYPSALAFLLRARHILEEVQSPGREKLQDALNHLQQEIGADELLVLLKDVEPRAETLVEQGIKEASALQH